ncbi:MAG: hypothetical protein ACI9WC_002702 [Arenicella sp.]|jgi:hypothetical protein
MNRTKLLFLLLAVGHLASAHELPHQQELTASCNSAQLSSQTINLISLDQTQAELWYNMDPTYPIPSGSVGASISKSSQGCSIYGYPPNDKPLLTCGEVDGFMKSALGAVNYCKALSQVPYFIGPESFVQAMEQDTLGSHHDDFGSDKDPVSDESIVFICLQACPKVLELDM